MHHVNYYGTGKIFVEFSAWLLKWDVRCSQTQIATCNPWNWNPWWLVRSLTPGPVHCWKSKKTHDPTRISFPVCRPIGFHIWVQVGIAWSQKNPSILLNTEYICERFFIGKKIRKDTLFFQFRLQQIFKLRVFILRECPFVLNFKSCFANSCKHASTHACFPGVGFCWGIFFFSFQQWTDSHRQATKSG